MPEVKKKGKDKEKNSKFTKEFEREGKRGKEWESFLLVATKEISISCDFLDCSLNYFFHFFNL